MINQDIIRHIIYTVYNAAINGMQIIDWIPAQNATDDVYGSFIYLVKSQEEKNGMEIQSRRCSYSQ